MRTDKFKFNEFIKNSLKLKRAIMKRYLEENKIPNKNSWCKKRLWEAMMSDLDEEPSVSLCRSVG
jgi:hypothetical protein